LSLPYIAGLIGSLATAPAIPTWYVSLNKPGFSPPNWIFAPVWTTLYLLMGIALYRVWSYQTKKSTKHRQEQAIKLFMVHLVLNAFWSVTFFGLQNPLLALAIIIAIVVTLIVIIKQFYRFDKLSAYILIPYLAWVTFATLLNFSIWQLN